MDELPPSLRDLISQARLDDDPTEDDARRVAAAMGAALPAFAPYASNAAPNGAAGALGGGAAKGGLVALAGAGKGFVTALMVGTAVTVAVVATYQSRSTRPHSPASAPAAAPAPAPAAANAPAPAAAPAATTSSTLPTLAPSQPAERPRALADAAREHSERTRPAVPSASETAEPTRADPTAESNAPEPVAAIAVPAPTPAGTDAPAATLDELALIRAATRALRDRDPGLAHRLLQQHAARFPAGVLSQERTGLTVLALCAQGRVAEGRALRERFLSEAPDSPLATRVRNACQAADPRQPPRQ